MTTTNEELAQRIEQLVRQHIAESQRTAREAVDRAFGAQRNSAASMSKAPQRRRRSALRRAPEEVARLGERLYAAICSNPGAGMAPLAAQIGTTTRELHRPMTRLKAAGRIRSVGARHQTKYFPMAAAAE